MTRLYGNAGNVCRPGDAAEVRQRADEPEQFLWRDKLYLVRAVLAHWMESGGWWRNPEPAAGPGGGVVDDRERELWRVEAGAGQRADTGVFDLCFDWSSGTWTVVRVQD